MSSQLKGSASTQNLSESPLLSNQNETNALPVQLERELMHSTGPMMHHLWNKDHGPKLNAGKSFVGQLTRNPE